MPQTFDCPKCRAPVAFERSLELGQTQPRVRCEYCHSQLIAPNELAGQPARVVRIHFGSGAGKPPLWLWFTLAIPLIGVIIAGLAMLVAPFQRHEKIRVPERGSGTRIWK